MQKTEPGYEEIFQELSNKYGAVITVTKDKESKAFTPQKEQNPVLPGFENITFPKLEEGE
jgi:hypothetical protein